MVDKQIENLIDNPDYSFPEELNVKDLYEQINLYLSIFLPNTLKFLIIDYLVHRPNALKPFATTRMKEGNPIGFRYQWILDSVIPSQSKSIKLKGFHPNVILYLGDIINEKDLFNITEYKSKPNDLIIPTTIWDSQYRIDKIQRFKNICDRLIDEENSKINNLLKPNIDNLRQLPDNTIENYILSIPLRTRRRKIRRATQEEENQGWNSLDPYDG